MGDFMNSNPFYKGGQPMLLNYNTLEILFQLLKLQNTLYLLNFLVSKSLNDAHIYLPGNYSIR